MDWTEIKISVPAKDITLAGDIAQMVVPYGIYIEDYSDLEQAAWEIAKIDLIDEELLKKDRNTAFVHVYLPVEENPAEAIAFLSERYTAAGIDFEIDSSVCRNQDWENNWKEYFKAFPVGKKLMIHPAWEPPADSQGRAVLEIEPGLAFGSGGHETTKLCLETLENYVFTGAELLDIGCGSGILGVASLLLGAESAVGVDIDALAVKKAQENAELNGFGPERFTVHQGDLTQKVSGRFDIVVANIVADVIIKLCADAAQYMKDDAVFITSGIIDVRENDVLEAFKKFGFKVIERREKNGWLCFVTEYDG